MSPTVLPPTTYELSLKLSKNIPNNEEQIQLWLLKQQLLLKAKEMVHDIYSLKKSIKHIDTRIGCLLEFERLRNQKQIRKKFLKKEKERQVQLFDAMDRISDYQKQASFFFLLTIFCIKYVI